MGSIVGDILGGGGDAAGDATQQIQQSNQQAIDEISRQFDLSRQDLAPFRAAPFPAGGTSAIGQFQALLGLGAPSGGGLTEQQIRQQVRASGQFGRRGGGGGRAALSALRGGGGRADIFQQGDTLVVPAALRGTGGHRDMDLVPPHLQQAFTAGDLNIEFRGPDAAAGGGGGGFDQAGFEAEVARLLAAQGAGGGGGGGSALGDALAALENSPGQQFIRSQAQKNLLANASAIGGLGGGNVRKALVEQGAGFASQDLQNQFARLQALINTGLGATTSTAGLGAQASGNIANLLQGSGQAGAQGILGAQQAKAQGFENLLGTVGLAAGGGFGPGIAGIFSDERIKTDIHDLNLQACFEAVCEMPLRSWRYLEEAGLDTQTHLGPMAQEAPDMVRVGEMDGVEMLSLHDELMMLAGAIQYMNNNDMLKRH